MTDNRPGSLPVEEARLLSICDLERHVGFINHCLLLPVLCASLLLLGKFNIRREATDRSLLLGECAACDQSNRGEEAGQASLPVPSPLLMWFLKGRAEKVTDKLQAGAMAHSSACAPCDGEDVYLWIPELLPDPSQQPTSLKAKDWWVKDGFAVAKFGFQVVA